MLRRDGRPRAAGNEDWGSGRFSSIELVARGRQTQMPNRSSVFVRQRVEAKWDNWLSRMGVWD